MLSRRVGGVLRCICDGGRLMVGMPNYETYAAHIRGRHPDAPVMTEVEFFRDRQNARFGEGGRAGLHCC